MTNDPQACARTSAERRTSTPSQPCPSTRSAISARSRPARSARDQCSRPVSAHSSNAITPQTNSRCSVSVPNHGAVFTRRRQRKSPGRRQWRVDSLPSSTTPVPRADPNLARDSPHLRKEYSRLPQSGTGDLLRWRHDRRPRTRSGTVAGKAWFYATERREFAESYAVTPRVGPSDLSGPVFVGIAGPRRPAR